MKKEEIKEWPDQSLIGRRVRKSGKIRTIIHLYSDIRGGVILDKPIEDFKSWNIDELEFIDETNS